MVAPQRRMHAAERREAIITAARRVFVDKGLDGARTRDIAAEAGVNEALLYRHFSSKDEIFEAAVSAPLEKAVASVVLSSSVPPEEFDESGDDMRARTRGFVVDLVYVMEEISDMLGVALFRQSAAATTYYRTRIAPSIDAVADVVRANLAHWNHVDFDPRFAVDMTLGSIWFLVTTAKLEGRQIDAERVADQMLTLLFDGLITTT